MNKALNTDVLIIGTGIIGLSIARALAYHSTGLKITLLEKESKTGIHTSSLNSGVLHAGIYYAPGSNKARLCPTGNEMLTKYSLDNKIPINLCGKLIVAKNEQEFPKINELFEIAKKNGVPVELVDEKVARSYEPHLGKSLQYPMIWSPRSSVGSPKLLVQKMTEELLSFSNVQVITGEGFKSLLKNTEDGVEIETTEGRTISTKKFVNSAGLHADRIAKKFDVGKEYAAVPLKGLYAIDKTPYKEYGLRTLIYPVPPVGSNNFLGVHTTLTTEGKLKLGPTAVPALWREHYTGFDRFQMSEFWEIAKAYVRIGFSSKLPFYAKLLTKEIIKSSGGNFLNEGRKLVDIYDGKDVNVKEQFYPATPGIRSQLIDLKTLSFVNDFVFINHKSHLHLLNMASPGWTSSLAIGLEMKDKILQDLKK